jgi:hypothetical protein
MWTHVIKIPVSSVVTQDAEGYPTTVTQYREIPASLQSAQRGDQILAEQKGYSADVVAVVMARNLYGLPGNWSQFTDVETGDVYELKRTYRQDRNRTIELTGQLVRKGVTS